jgi:hypothetical protein
MTESGSMTQATAPFRPREASADSPATVLRQAGRVRRRANLAAAQNLLYVTGASVAATASLLLVLALSTSSLGFAIATWVAFALLVTIVLRGTGRLRRDWIGGRAAAVAIDRRAKLEERLATLAASADARRSSRLWDHLLRQNLRLLPRWAPHRLVPRAMPRTVWPFAAALLAAWLVFRWFAPGADEYSARAKGRGRGNAAASESETSSWNPLTAFPERLRDALLRSRQKRPDVQQGAGGSVQAKARPGEAIDESAPSVDGKVENPDGSMTPPDDANAPSAEGDAAGAPPRPAASGPGRAGPEPRPSGSEGDPSNAPNDGEPLRGDAPKALPRVESGRPRAPGQAPQAGKPPAPSEKGGTGAAGAGLGGDAAGLFGPHGEPIATNRSFTLDLAGQGAASAGDEGGDDPGIRPRTDLSADQRLDDAIRRAQVPAEYESIVQRVFSRGEEGAAP